MRGHRVLRRLVLLASAAALLAAANAAGAADRLPLRNLLVEVRQGEAARFESDSAGLNGGAVVVGRDGAVAARAGVTLEARGGDARRDSVQQLRVINGGQGALRIGASVPMQWLQWVWTPQGPAAIAGTQLVETGRGFVVQPRWPGGDAPVTVELRSESAALEAGGVSRYAPDGVPLAAGAVERSGVLTTLQLPLGDWVTVASSGESRSATASGVLSSRDAAADRRIVVQMRVTAP